MVIHTSLPSTPSACRIHTISSVGGEDRTTHTKLIHATPAAIISVPKTPTLLMSGKNAAVASAVMQCRSALFIGNTEHRTTRTITQLPFSPRENDRRYHSPRDCKRLCALPV